MGGGKGGKGQKGGVGTWVWVPDAGPQKPILPSRVLPRLGGKGAIHVAPYAAKTLKYGLARPVAPAAVGKPPLSKWEEKLKKMDPSLKVWVGGLPEDYSNWKELQQHFASISKPVVCDVMKRGTAVVAYKTIEEVETAIATLNGSELGGNTIEVDVWVKKPKPEVPTRNRQRPQAVAKKAVKPVLKTQVKGKVQGRTRMDDKIKEKLKAFDETQKVWIGGLPETATWKELADHLATVAQPKLTNILNKGQGVAAYESADDAATVIATLNGSELEGHTLELDVWTKPEPRERTKGRGKGA
eukprot:TRINITY_DN48071_c0_g1_i1.p1 TRINITY_DN48071_c0_g1~~TRINITY_DN48071_c0_g1_i1.p1  ORF type:complete len:299 (+),score=69.38 TRINITY_DN48071_c0_g1_i1:111-1007(+)